MTDIPRYAIAVRQPWAWAIMAGLKPVENRSIAALRHMIPGLDRLGPQPRIAVHASKGMHKAEYDGARAFMAKIGVTCPPAIELIRGAILGSVEYGGIVKAHDSPWFFGPRALILRDPEIWTPIPAVGALGLFVWRRDDTLSPPPVPRWMQPATARPAAEPLAQSAPAVPEPDLFAAT